MALSSGAAAESGTSKLSGAKICARAIAHNRPTPTRLLHTTPPAALTSILEVLRRPAASTDQLPLSGIPPSGYPALWIDSARLLATEPDQTRYFLIPGISDLFQLPPSCLRELAPEARQPYETQAREQREGSVSVEEFNAEGPQSAFPYTGPTVASGRAFRILPVSSSLGTSVTGVEPDGVASVTVTLSSNPPVTVPLVNNFFLATIPGNKDYLPLVVQSHTAEGSLITTHELNATIVGVPLRADQPTMILVPPPPEVTNTGGQPLSEFELGRTVVAQSGCLACHRIGNAGNHGPGQPLTHVGSTLSESQIEHAIIAPTPPMPSFKNLPAVKLKAVVKFLTLLR